MYWYIGCTSEYLTFSIISFSLQHQYDLGFWDFIR